MKPELTGAIEPSYETRTTSEERSVVDKAYVSEDSAMCAGREREDITRIILPETNIQSH